MPEEVAVKMSGDAKSLLREVERVRRQMNRMGQQMQRGTKETTRAVGGLQTRMGNLAASFVGAVGLRTVFAGAFQQMTVRVQETAAAVTDLAEKLKPTLRLAQELATQRGIAGREAITQSSQEIRDAARKGSSTSAQAESALAATDIFFGRADPKLKESIGEQLTAFSAPKQLSEEEVQAIARVAQRAQIKTGAGFEDLLSLIDATFQAFPEKSVGHEVRGVEAVGPKFFEQGFSPAETIALLAGTRQVTKTLDTAATSLQRFIDKLGDPDRQPFFNKLARAQGFDQPFGELTLNDRINVLQAEQEVARGKGPLALEAFRNEAFPEIRARKTLEGLSVGGAGDLKRREVLKLAADRDVEQFRIENKAFLNTELAIGNRAALDREQREFQNRAVTAGKENIRQGRDSRLSILERDDPQHSVGSERAIFERQALVDEIGRRLEHAPVTDERRQEIAGNLIEQVTNTRFLSGRRGPRQARTAELGALEIEGNTMIRILRGIQERNAARLQKDILTQLDEAIQEQTGQGSLVGRAPASEGRGRRRGPLDHGDVDVAGN